MYKHRRYSESRRGRDVPFLQEKTRRTRSRSPLLRNKNGLSQREYGRSECTGGLMDIMSPEVRVRSHRLDNRRCLNHLGDADARHRINFRESQPSPSVYKHASMICMDYECKRMDCRGEDGVQSIAQRLGHTAEAQLFEARQDETQSAIAGSSRVSSSSASHLESLQATAAEIMRLQHSARMDQIRIYKDSKDYKVFDEHFPKHNKRYERPPTPDQMSIPPSQWMAKFNQWKADVAEILEKKKIKSRVVENDEETLMRRQKNIDYCKSTEAYHQYLTLIPNKYWWQDCRDTCTEMGTYAPSTVRSCRRSTQELSAV
ncbi:uncharacterized protein [Watersipora subatra]|uniref:uncharacterized protein isoform X2 n=1 Tax=Watersipora subatra TaxID=2589382 RepID=UPI00355C70D3